MDIEDFIGDLMSKPRSQWILVHRYIANDDVDPICCSEKCPLFLNRDGEAICTLSGSDRPLRQSIYKKWHRTPVCLKGEGLHKSANQYKLEV